MGGVSYQAAHFNYVGSIFLEVRFPSVYRPGQYLLSCRKLLLLFNWLAPLTTIIAQQESVPFSSEKLSNMNKKGPRPFMQSLLYAPPPVLLEFVHAIADDVYTMSLLGLLGKKNGDRAGRFSDWCWFLATLVGLVENNVERGMIVQQRREGEAYLLRTFSVSF